MNQEACHTGLPNIGLSSTVCISRTTQSRSELSADLTGMNVRWGEYCFVYFGKPFMNVRVQDKKQVDQGSAVMYSMRSREYDVAGTASTFPSLNAFAYRAY